MVWAGSSFAANSAAELSVTRLVDGPIVHPGSHPGIGHNIQGPSLIRVPGWVPDPLGTYYLYFADHKGTNIRLAYADDLTGPWTVYSPGCLQLEESRFLTEPPALDDTTLAAIEQAYREVLGDAMMPEIRVDLVTPHVASPDVHVDLDTRTVDMYFHGLAGMGDQQTRVATSADGLNFTVQPALLGPSYFRVFRHGGFHYALVMPGSIMRSRDGHHDFEMGPVLFEPAMRHSAVRVVEETLEVYWTRVGDMPERIYRSTVELAPEWMDWVEGRPEEVLRPERSWEGTDVALAASRRGAAAGRVNELRDPAVFEEDGVMYLLYAVAGESGIAISRVD